MWGLKSQDGERYPVTPAPNPSRIDRARMTALFGDRLDEALALLANYAGDNAYAVRAADAARAWIDERRDSAPQRTEQPTAPDEAES